MNLSKEVSQAVLLSVVAFFSVAAQDIQVKGAKDKTAIPPACESIVPASIDDEVDVKALVKESNCKGSSLTFSEYKRFTTEVKDQTPAPPR